MQAPVPLTAPGGPVASAAPGAKLLKTPQLLGKHANAHPPSLRGLLDLSVGRDNVKDSQLVIRVETGDRLNSGTDALVTVKLADNQGKWSKEIKLSQFGKNNFERGHTDSFNVRKEDIDGFDVANPNITKLEIWRNNFGINASWFVDVVTVENLLTGQLFPFPLHRWIDKDLHYSFLLYDSILPQLDPHRQQRDNELKEKKQVYIYDEKKEGAPVQVKQLPQDEEFGKAYQVNVALDALRYSIDADLGGLGSGTHFRSIEELENLYKRSLPLPDSQPLWRDDRWFGQQRLQGCNPVQIRLLTTPHANLPIDEKVTLPIIGSSLAIAIAHKRIFYIDYKVLDKLTNVPKSTPEIPREICAPIALFYLDHERKYLLPLAIQLHQIPGQSNPIFYPTDEPSVWVIAKMWFNNADANYHQACTHLGFTHLIMESAAVCANRNLSRSHPLFKLLAPHFLYLQAINAAALEKLVQPGGWVDKTLVIGAGGLFELVGRASQNWRLDVEATVPNDCVARGVSDKNVLPNYPYRDDAIRIYEAIREYVDTIVHKVYDTPEKIQDDVELQNFGRELVLPKKEGGIGYLGVPISDGKFRTVKEIVTTVAAIISTCSMTHAAVNFNQYDEYGFPPNYPTRMSASPPNKKTGYTEADIAKHIPNKDVTKDIMAITKLLSSKGTKSLGDFEVQFAYDPVSLVALRRLKHDLEAISIEIAERNANPPAGTLLNYPWLDPEIIPNAISI